jgi:hypothetical protein
LEKLDAESLLSMDPTVKASGSDAGELFEASLWSFPAATAKNKPLWTAEATALLSAGFLGPPKDMFATFSPFVSSRHILHLRGK